MHSTYDLIRALPKAELHLHIEGTLEPELLFALADKHGVSLPYDSVEQLRGAYHFDSLQSFLDLYYRGADVLRDEDDFYQLMYAYLSTCREQNIVHAEIMFDPQTHTGRGIGFDVFMPGLIRGIEAAQQEWGMSALLIMSFLRDLDEDSALETLVQARPYLHNIAAVGLDSAEKGNPPEKFARVFANARELGLKTLAHAGEEGPPSYIWGALATLQVARIDHGVRATEDSALVAYLKAHQTPLTVCPLSNVKLKVFEVMEQHNLKHLMEAGLMVTVNSDDPAYFGGYLNDNLQRVAEALELGNKDIITLIKNSFCASFLDAHQRDKWLERIVQFTG